MNLNEVSKNFKCALSNDDHVAQEPISLNCGHCICKSCLLKSEYQNIITCKLCNQVTNRDLKNEKESTLVKSMIAHFLSQLFVELENKTSEGVNKLKGNELFR